MSRKYNAIIFVLLVMSMANVFLSYLAMHPFREHMFNSDGLLPSALFSDLIDKGGDIKNWLLSPAPYFFPDYVFFFLAHVFGKNVYNEFIIFAFFQIALTFLAVWFLFRYISKATAFYSATVVIIGWIWLALNHGIYFAFLLLSAHHYGIFLSSLFFLALWLNLRQQQALSVSLLCAMAIVTFLSALSDSLFLVQTLIPFLGIGIFIDVIKRDFTFNKIKLVMLIPTASGILGYGIYRFIVPNDTRYYADIGLEEAKSRLNILFHYYADIIQAPLYGLLFLGYVSSVIYTLYCLFTKERNSLDVKPMLWLSLFSFLSFMSTLCAIILVTNIPLGIRYIIPSLFWPLFIVVSFSVQMFSRRSLAAATALSAIAVLSLSSNTYTLIKKNGLQVNYYPSEIACIDESLEKAQVYNGIAHYWDARPVQLFSRLTLNIAQYRYPLEEHPHVVSKQSFRTTYDFIIFPGNGTLSFNEVERINGKPPMIKYCGDKTLYIYGKDKLKTQKSL